MAETDLLPNFLLLFGCYAYVLVIITVSSRFASLSGGSPKLSRKFLHIMIGNLPFVIPFFTLTSFPLDFPFLVAAPFVIVTFLATPYSPLKRLTERFGGLGGITEQGHQLGLVFYAVSYTVLALFFSARPYIIAAGILPMAYGDASASLVGEKYGRTRFRLLADKSVEGSAAMFTIGLAGILVGLFYFSAFYPINPLSLLWPALGSMVIATLAEGLTPLGFDNVTVPLLGALTFLVLSGGL